MSTLYLVACCKRKLPTSAPARDIYIGTLFKSTRAYVLSQLRPGDDWMILSTKYHLVRPQRELDPYEMTLNTLTAQERRNWAHHVLRMLIPVAKTYDKLVLFAGANYTKYLLKPLGEAGITVELPLLGKGGYGSQVKWIREQNR